MKWIYQRIKKNLQLISTRSCFQFDTTTVFLHKNNKHQEVKEKILKCLCPHVGCVAP